MTVFVYRWPPGLLMCSILLAASGCTIHDDEITGRILAPQSLEFDGQSTTIPLLFKGERPFVEVMVNGQGPYLFLLDTGCPFTSISSSLAQSLSLPASRVSHAEPGQEAKRALRIRELQIGGALFRGCLVTPWTFDDNLNNVNGILGMNLFIHCQVQLDFANNEMRLLRERLTPEADNSTSFKLVHTFRPIIQVTFQDGVARRSWPVVVDTGYPLCFELPCSIAEWPFETVTEKAITHHSLYGQYRCRFVEAKADALLGAYTISPVYVAVPERTLESGEGIVGMRILRRFVLAFDLRVKTMSLMLREAQASDTPEHGCTSPGDDTH